MINDFFSKAKYFVCAMIVQVANILGFVGKDYHKRKIESYRKLIVKRLHIERVKDDEVFKVKLRESERSIRKNLGLIDPDPVNNNDPIVSTNWFYVRDDDIHDFDNFLISIGRDLNINQKSFLYSKEPAVNVVAGAGAGKSTVLALRVLFLVKYIRVPFGKITLTTFTRKSRFDLADKLVEVFNAYRDYSSHQNRPSAPLTVASARKRVRTFHSVAYEVNKVVGGGTLKIIQGERSLEVGEDDPQGSNLGEDQADSIGVTDKSIPPLSEIMNYVYKLKYTNDSKFTEIIDFLKKESYSSNRGKRNIESLTRYVNEYRNTIPYLPEYTEKLWKKYKPELFNRMIRFYSRGNMPIEDYISFSYHYYLPNLNAYIFLSTTGYETKEDKNEIIDGGQGRSAEYILNRHKSISDLYASLNYIVVDDPDDLEILYYKELHRFDRLPETSMVPRFSYACEGDLVGYNNYNICEQMGKLIDFVYSMGDSLGEKTELEINDLFSQASPGDRVFVLATSMFQRYLEEEFNKRNLVTYNQIFHDYSKKTSQGLEEIVSLDHLMIDEFQDVSPNIINFLNRIKSLRVSKSNPSDVLSLLTVGDDCQSIYGWRGGSIDYILNFDKSFPLPSRSKRVDLIMNYRSSKLILDKASNLFRFMDNEVKSYEVPEKNMHCQLSSFSIFPPGSKNGSIDYDTFNAVILKECARVNPSESNPIYILYPTNKMFKWSEIDKNIRERIKKKTVVHMTIHKSKGLESEAVFVLGDIKPGRKNPVKNCIYKWKNKNKSYDVAMKGESMRLGYVAITRAEKRLYWFSDVLPENLHGRSDTVLSCYIKDFNQ